MKKYSQYRAVAVALVAVAVAGCSGTLGSSSAKNGPYPVKVVAIERVYGDLASQLGTGEVAVTTILNSPTADPHEYEPTTADAAAVAGADVVIENGLGYDAFADKLLAASPKPDRTVITVGTLAGYATGANPHVWYDTKALNLFARALTRELVRRRQNAAPALTHRENVLDAWISSLEAREAAIARASGGARVAITEPVFDYVLRAAHLVIATPEGFSHAIEEGTDPAPQDVATMHALLAGKRVAAFVYNSQTVEPATTQLLALAKGSGVPVVPVTETLPTGVSTQRWIDGEIAALAAVLPHARRK